MFAERVWLLLFFCVTLVRSAPLIWSWARPQTFIHCSNSSGSLSPEATLAMANSAFTVIEKYQGLKSPPLYTGGEIKVIEAARAVRSINPNATMIFYFAVDYTRTWYDLGRWFDEHPYLQVHDADGWRANHTENSDNWGIFDWSQEEARSAWVDKLASVVSSSDDNGNNIFDGVFIDGYRSAESWAPGLIPKATQEEQTAWLAGAKLLGPALSDALGNDTIRFINPGQVFNEFPGYSANSIEFFGPDDNDIQFLQSLIGTFPTIEVHSYIGPDIANFNLTFAAYLIGVGPGAYFGAGAEWDMCDDWRECLISISGLFFLTLIGFLPPPPPLPLPRTHTHTHTHTKLIVLLLNYLFISAVYGRFV